MNWPLRRQRPAARFPTLVASRGNRRRSFASRIQALTTNDENITDAQSWIWYEVEFLSPAHDSASVLTCRPKTHSPDDGMLTTLLLAGTAPPSSVAR